MSPLWRAIRDTVAAVPPGRVSTYGTIARLCGHPRAARTVVWVLRARSTVDRLPWHRIVAAGGRVALPRGDGFEEQCALLRDEGVAVSPAGRVDMSRFGWSGE